MATFLFLGFLVGLRHALEADHVAAVASLATDGASLRDQVRRGALWGMGHTASLLVFAGGSILLGLAIPAGAERLLEAAVGAMLVVLGGSVLLGLRRAGVHVHAHRHGGGPPHLHAHAHRAAEAHGGAHAHDHRHGASHAPGLRGLRALAVGALHGLAGSAALVLLVAGASGSGWLALAYIACFGAGSIAGMALLAGAIALPLCASARGPARLHAALGLLAGGVSVALGAQLLWTQLA